LSFWREGSQELSRRRTAKGIVSRLRFGPDDSYKQQAPLQGERRVKFQETQQILDVKGAAEYLQCSKSHLSNILAGKVPNVPPIPHVSAGRRKLIRLEALLEWFKTQETASQKMVPKC
jgi:hypothetical protein